ncbi:MAG TPA: hypothetical protein VGS27_06710 [Candidatus Sulfotelmatobacter sp.]|nr:hypothetical protein [Candidatus Sulfotelmatobacter sp.]
MKKTMVAILITASWMSAGSTLSAQRAPPQESTTQRHQRSGFGVYFGRILRSKRKQLIAASLRLTDTDAAKFWPLYDQYVTELSAINDKKFALIHEYADNWGKLTNDQSLLFVRNWLDMDIAIAQLRQKYVPIVAKVLDGKEDGNFFQLDRRIATMLDLQVSSRMPMVQDQREESSSKSVN